MPRSMYLELYLAETATGHLVTPGTFLARQLRGKAKAHAGHYKQALVRALQAEPNVKAVPSAMGSVAYVRVPAAQEVR
jgi:hypothetical protein